MLFVDTQDEEWYEYRTKPSEINIHYVYMMMPDVFESGYKDPLVTLGILGKKAF